MEAPEGGLNILTLEQVSGGGQVLLQREDLPQSGEYAIQLRATARADGAVQRHSTVVRVFIPRSLSGTRRGRRSPPSLRSWSSGCSG